MKFCVLNDEREGTCYHEFYKGRWDEDKLEFWRDDSIYVHDNIFWEYPELSDVFKEVVPSYDPFEMIEFSQDDWKKIGLIVKGKKQDTQDFYNELNDWVQPVLQEYGVFTILGI